MEVFGSVDPRSPESRRNTSCRPALLRVISNRSLTSPVDSGNPACAARWSQDKSHAHSQARQHVDQSVGAKQVDPAAKEVTHSRLSYAQDFRDVSLSVSAGRDPFLNLNHKVRTDLEVLSFLYVEAEVTKNIAA